MSSPYRSKHLHSPSYYDVQPRITPGFESLTHADRKWAWYSFQRAKSPSTDEFTSAHEREAEHLRFHASEQEREISSLRKRLQTRDQQHSDLQAKWNFHSFKYQLLIDMWAMRVLDNESEEEADYR